MSTPSQYGKYPNPFWKPPVSTASALPTIGNIVGDMRITLDTFTLYVWNGSSWINPLIS